MLKIQVCFILLVLYSCISENDYLKKADVAIEKENYREALVLLDKALVKNKYSVDAYMEMGFCYSMLKNDDSAFIAYQKIISTLPNNTLALVNAGNCKYRSGKFEDAILFYGSAMLTKGYNPYDSIEKRITFEYSPEGKELLGVDDRYDVPLPEIFYRTGLAHYEIGKISQAYRYFSKAIAGKYFIGESYYMIGMCWLVSNNKDKACEAFKNSVMSGFAEASKEIDNTCKLKN